jgi:uncharacterized protein
MKISIILYAIIVFSNVANAASFNCSKATKEVEFTICNNPPLDNADAELGNIYKKLKRTLSNEESVILRKEQRMWINQRDQECPASSYGCLMSQITLRKQELQSRLNIPQGSQNFYAPVIKVCNSTVIDGCRGAFPFK